jgi:selenocysteine lyase/cysteine desulfurase
MSGHGIACGGPAARDPNAQHRIETRTLNHAAIDGARAAVEYLAGWGSGVTLRERIVDAMGGISTYENQLAKFCHDAVARMPGVRIWGPNFDAGARAPTVSITLESATADQAARALGSEGICMWDGHFYAARARDIGPHHARRLAAHRRVHVQLARGSRALAGGHPTPGRRVIQETRQTPISVPPSTEPKEPNI